MSNDREQHDGDGSGGRFHTVQPLRDLESNWAVDLAKNLEDYLFKICSGEISGNDDSHTSINFAEAALLLQGSVQVYSRKVEYLYSLVLHALEFISQKSQQIQPESTSAQPEESGCNAPPAEENDQFWGLDDIQVEPKNCLDSATTKDTPLSRFEKPPANLVVLEGDCLDTTGDGGELETYLLATNDLYQDFILLDLCDAIAVDDFLSRDDRGKGYSALTKGTSLNSKARKSFLSPTRRSGGTVQKSAKRAASHAKGQDADLNQFPMVDRIIEFNECNMGHEPPSGNNYPGFEPYDGYSEPGDLDDSDGDDDPWKPLNPHEPGTLKVKPFRKVKAKRRSVNSTKRRVPIATQFPLARKTEGTIDPELSEIWEVQCHTSMEGEPHPLSFYGKLRESLVHGGNETPDDPFNPNEENEYDDSFPDFMGPDDGEEIPFHHEKDDGGAVHLDPDDGYVQDDSYANASLEDLCRSHLDSLLSSIAETEKQTEIAARVSTWKQRIEHNLEEQDSRPPFDIHVYGDRILDTLSSEAVIDTDVSFADVVRGQKKPDVARTFSALLQLVNNRNIDLKKPGPNGKSICYTSENPFQVRLLCQNKRHEEVQLRSSKKRAKSPLHKGGIKGASKREKITSIASSSLDSISSPPNGKFPAKTGKIVAAKCTPEGKKRRKSRIPESVDLHSAG